MIWNKMVEETPKIGEIVDIYTALGRYVEVEFDGEGFETENGDYFEVEYVSHWMESVPPPSDDEKIYIVSKSEIERLQKRDAILKELFTKIEDAQGTYNEETDEYNENEDCDLCKIGEITMNILNLW